MSDQTDKVRDIIINIHVDHSLISMRISLEKELSCLVLSSSSSFELQVLLMLKLTSMLADYINWSDYAVGSNVSCAVSAH